MVDFKLVLNDPKTGKSYSREQKDADALIGKSIGDKVEGKELNLAGYEFELKGGSDNCGFPMRKDVGFARKRILAVQGIGMKKKGKGQKSRKTVAGSRISAKTSQVNLQILKYGKEKLDAGSAEEKQ